MGRLPGVPLLAVLTTLAFLCGTGSWRESPSCPSGWFAWGAATAAAQEPEPPSVQPESAAETVVEMHDRVSRTVSEVAGWLDEYLGDERYEAEANRSRVKLKMGAFLEEGESVDFTPVFIIRLVLPRTSHRLHFIASRGSASTLDYDEDQSDPSLERFQLADDDNMFAALRYFIWKEAERNFSVEGGIQYLHNDETVGFTSLRYRQFFDMDPWALRYTQKLGVYTGPQWGTSAVLDLDRRVWGDNLFRLTNQLGYLSDGEDLYYDLKFKLVQGVSQTQVIEYKWENYFNLNRDSRLDESVAIVNFRQRLHWDWLYGEIAPQVSFPRKNDYEFTLGITFRLEIKFGMKYLSSNEEEES